MAYIHGPILEMWYRWFEQVVVLNHLIPEKSPVSVGHRFLLIISNLVANRILKGPGVVIPLMFPKVNPNLP